MLRERRRHASFKPNRKLDRKSSRGMIYENEELRLRTININAEVERGQSDIKKLRRENYQLRKEIWSLRDEYDRLGKLIRNRNCEGYGDLDLEGNDDDNENDDVNDEEDDDDSDDYECDDDFRCCSCHSNEDSISCDICNEDNYFQQNDNCLQNIDIIENTLTKTTMQNTMNNSSNSSTGSILKSSRPEKLNINFDHLSVVSEECLSNSDDQIEQQRRLTASIGIDTLTPDNTSAEILYAEFQSTVPSLAHFENLSYKDIGPNIDSMGELMYNSESTPTTGETVIPATEWDFSLHQPVGRKSPATPPLPPPPSSSSLLPAIELDPDANALTPKQLKNFFAPLKSKQMKRKLVGHKNEPENQNQLRPDLYISNVLASETNKLATIRKPHKPLKCPASEITNPKSNIDLDDILHDIEDLSKDIEQMQFHHNEIYDGSDAIVDTYNEQPYRTEMNLILSYDGHQSKFTEKSQHQNSFVSESENTDTPPPNVPHAMELLPNTLPYVIMENTNYAANESSAFDSKQMEKENTENDTYNTNPDQNISKKINFVRSSDDNNKEQLTPKIRRNSNPIAVMRKHLFCRKSSALKINCAIVAGKDKGSTADEVIGTNETELQNDDDATDTAKNGNCNYSSNKKQLVRGKSMRRVSINFNGKKSLESSMEIDGETPNNTLSVNVDEPLTLTPILSSRRHHSTSSRKMSQDSISSFFHATPFSSNKRGKNKTLLSRRHSDGLLPNTQRHPYYHDNSNSKHSHHHHHNHGHHHHHPSISYKERDSFQEAGTSISERCSNSLASSRESSTSLSLHSTAQPKRKISITSHSQSGGKIPWCACWGNGCL